MPRLLVAPTAWWITFFDGSKGTVELAAAELPTITTPLAGTPEDKARVFEEYHGLVRDAAIAAANELGYGPVEDAKPLPYPAFPRLRICSSRPTCCVQPDACAGRSDCPRNPACHGLMQSVDRAGL